MKNAHIIANAGGFVRAKGGTMNKTAACLSVEALI